MPATKSNGKTEKRIVVPEVPPFGLTILYGKKGQGKTLGGINSPWEPVHVIDVEGSSADYFKHQPRLIKEGILAHEFTRAECPTFEHFDAEIKRILGSSEKYGTLVIDTGGQFTQWVSDDTFAKNQDKVEKQSQVVWGKVRDRLRNVVLKLEARSKLVIVTAHERKYGNVFSPRVNPALIELSALQIRLVRDPNRRLPDAIIDGARLPFFPPRIPAFGIVNLLNYFDNPADWDNLSEEEKAPLEAVPVMGAEEMED